MTEARDPPDLTDPPTGPHLPRRIHLYRYQWIGLPLLALLPILAIFRFFGDTSQRVDASSDAVRLEVVYPDRQRVGQKRQLEVRIENVSGNRLDTVTVSFDPSYVDRFNTVSFVPEPRSAYQIELLGVEPREHRLIRIETEGAEPWRHQGEVSVASPGSDPAGVRVSTFVFP
jgi:hypothetical protein